MPMTNNIYNRFLDKISRQLEKKEIIVKETSGAIVDATIIESSRRPGRVMDVCLTLFKKKWVAFE